MLLAARQRGAGLLAKLAALIAIAPPLGCGQGDDVIARPRIEQAGCEQACGAPACPCPRATQIAVTPAIGAPFRIDATERTIAEYAAFVRAHPGAPGGSAGDVCSWNESYVPSTTTLDLDQNCRFGFSYEELLATSPRRPIVCVDWCDARDYCAWSGGRLCERTTGGDLALVQRATLEDEWYVACSAGATRRHAYGDTFDPTACNTQDSGNDSNAVAVATLPRCEGGVPGLFDMNGNVKEWVAACAASTSNTHADAMCFRVGGAFFEDRAELSRCDSGTEGLRSTAGNDTGFRCCFDP